MNANLSDYLRALEEEDSYRVDAVLKEGEIERTEKVYLVREHGPEKGPFVRKFFAVSDGDSAIGGAYERIYQAQKDGQHFEHLPRIFECYGVGERRCVVMDYVEGDTLAEVVHRRGPSLALVREVFPPLCDAVRELHEEFAPPLIHRDLKPSNIVVTSDGVSIIDFGITRSFREGADADTTRFGTRSYAPPEQFGFGQTDVRSDIYALGSLLYFCLSEQTPDAEVRSAEYRSDRVPEHLRQVIVKATAFDPANRYADVDEFEKALLAAIDDPGQPSTLIAKQKEVEEESTESVGVPEKDVSEPDEDVASVSETASEHKVEEEQEEDASNSEQVTYHSVNFAEEPSDSKPTQTLRPDQRQRPPASGTHNPFRRFLAAIPRPVGIVWDLLLLASFALFEFGAIWAIVNPNEANDALSTASLIVSYHAMTICLLLPILFFISDRRPLRRIIKPLARVSFRQELVVCVIVFIIGLILVSIFYRPA